MKEINVKTYRGYIGRACHINLWIGGLGTYLRISRKQALELVEDQKGDDKVTAHARTHSFGLVLWVA